MPVLAVRITDSIFFSGAAPVREPHLVAVILISDNRRAGKCLGYAEAVRNGKTLSLPMVSVIGNRMIDHMQHFAVTGIPSCC